MGWACRWGTGMGIEYIEHSGEVSGFVSENIVFPDDKVAVTVLTNEDASSAAGALATEDCAAGAGWGVSRQFECGGGGGGEAGAGYLYGVAGWEAGPDAVDGVLRCVLYAGGGAGFCVEPEAAGSADAASNRLAEEKRGGMTFRVFSVSFPNKQVRVTVYEEPDGKLEQYLVIAGLRKLEVHALVR